LSGRLVLAFIFRPFLRWLYEKSQPEEHLSFRLLSVNKDRREEHIRTTRKAIDLIKSVDPRRFLRVQKEIRYIIIFDNMKTRASYNRATRTCSVSAETLLPDKVKKYLVEKYAATLVHEATHGSMYSRRVPYTSETKKRIERLCEQEAQRFFYRATRTSMPANSRRIRRDSSQPSFNRDPLTGAHEEQRSAKGALR
jgi:hypothetical protein